MDRVGVRYLPRAGGTRGSFYIRDDLKGSPCIYRDIPMDTKKVTDDFYRMLALADLGARWHSDRRQVAFRIFVSYMTLLVLALYQVIKLLGQKDVVIPGWIILLVSGGLFFTHVVYCKWQGSIRKALINDVRRRDFFLKKAEQITYYLSQDSGLSPISKAYNSGDPVMLNLGSGDYKETTEPCLFKQREPDIIGGDRHGKQDSSGKYPPRLWWKDRHFLVQVIGPTFLLILLILLVFTLFFKRLGWFC